MKRLRFRGNLDRLRFRGNLDQLRISMMLMIRFKELLMWLRKFQKCLHKFLLSRRKQQQQESTPRFPLTAFLILFSLHQPRRGHTRPGQCERSSTDIEGTKNSTTGSANQTSLQGQRVRSQGSFQDQALVFHIPLLPCPEGKETL
ncbi:hypothetical protein Dimus_008012 [Dionaea muscipula]